MQTPSIERNTSKPLEMLMSRLPKSKALKNDGSLDGGLDYRTRRLSTV
jgi:hypothetical protein